jgi:hypothetical protein
MLVSIGVILANLLFCAVGIMILLWYGWLTALGFVVFVIIGSLFLRLTIIAGFLLPPISLWLSNAAAVFFLVRTLLERYA